MRVCVTGASGFIGRHATAFLDGAGHEVVAITRGETSGVRASRIHRIDVTADAGWSDAMVDCDAVLHLAGRAHIIDELESDPLAAFRRINVDGALRVAAFACAASVSRFVLVSSIGVNGNVSMRPFSANDVPAPVEQYALSKLEAEEALREYCARVGMQLVIVRPALVYGPGNPGNFLRLLKLAAFGWPLPLASVRSLRSYIGVYNLVSMLERCLWHEGARGQVLLAADGQDIALPQVLALLGSGMGRSITQLHVPPAMLRLGGALIGRTAVVERLVGTLQVDASPTFSTLDWQPPRSVEQGMLETGRWYAQSSLQGDPG